MGDPAAGDTGSPMCSLGSCGPGHCPGLQGGGCVASEVGPVPGSRAAGCTALLAAAWPGVSCFSTARGTASATLAPLLEGSPD